MLVRRVKFGQATEVKFPDGTIVTLTPMPPRPRNSGIELAVDAPPAVTLNHIKAASTGTKQPTP
ncbi:MAG TPA: hypothetical protein VHC22_24460 [Pirellulales bacterium]|nr:hypothetical protein [Pirellulales bacterium]